LKFHNKRAASENLPGGKDQGIFNGHD